MRLILMEISEVFQSPILSKFVVLIVATIYGIIGFGASYLNRHIKSFTDRLKLSLHMFMAIWFFFGLIHANIYVYILALVGFFLAFELITKATNGLVGSLSEKLGVGALAAIMLITIGGFICSFF